MHIYKSDKEITMAGDDHAVGPSKEELADELRSIITVCLLVLFVAAVIVMVVFLGLNYCQLNQTPLCEILYN